MKENVLNSIHAAINAMNNISVMGKANLGNLAGSITLLEEVAGVIAEAEFVEKDAAE